MYDTMWWTSDTMKDLMDKVDSWLSSKGNSIEICTTNLSSWAWVATFSGRDASARSGTNYQFVIVYKKK